MSDNSGNGHESTATSLIRRAQAADPDAWEHLIFESTRAVATELAPIARCRSPGDRDDQGRVRQVIDARRGTAICISSYTFRASSPA